MYLGRARRWTRSITVKLLSLYFALFVFSSFTFFLLAYAVIYHSVDINENEIIYNELNEIASKSVNATREDIEEIAANEIYELGSNNIIIRIDTGPDVTYLPTREDWLAFLHDFQEMGTFEPGRIVRLYAQNGTDMLKVGKISLPNDNSTVYVGYRAMSQSSLLAQSTRIFNTIFVPVLILGLFVGWFMAKRALSDIAKVRMAAEKIYEGNLDMRVQRSYNGDEIDHLSDTFNLMLSRIQTLIRNMGGMLDNVAHDLRTPLTRLRGMAEAALSRDMPQSEYQRILEQFIGEYDGLITLINTILNISDAQSGSMTLKKTRFRVIDLLEAVYEFYQPLALENHIEFRIECDHEFCLSADFERLRQVFLNLLDNAFKYVPSGGRVELRCSLAGQEIFIGVSDTGPGINPDDLPYIFQRFYRSDKGRTRKGYGLGLSLVKAIVELHGGRVMASSKLGEGTDIIVTLPRAERDKNACV